MTTLNAKLVRYQKQSRLIFEIRQAWFKHRQDKARFGLEVDRILKKTTKENSK